MNLHHITNGLSLVFVLLLGLAFCLLTTRLRAKNGKSTGRILIEALITVTVTVLGSLYLDLDLLTVLMTSLPGIAAG